MWTKLFIFLWIADTIKQRSTSLQFDCAKRVQRCPVGKEQWLQKNEELQCRTNYGYVCLRDSIGYIYESCMANFTVQANIGNCPVMFCNENKPHIGTGKTFYRCPEEVPGCPPRNHPGYRMHHLYKYPKCVESSFSTEIENTSPTSTESSLHEVNRKENRHVVILIVCLVALLAVVGIVTGYVVYSRKKRHDFFCCRRNTDLGHIQTNAEESHLLGEGHIQTDAEGSQLPGDKTIKDLRNAVHEVNESEADRVQILPLKAGNTTEIERIYVPVSIVEDYGIKTIDKRNVSKITPDKMFHVHENQAKKPARFVFMLGEAGYGKTIQCQRIAKSWCQVWKNESMQKRDHLEVTDLESSLKEFDFLFFVQMRDVNHELVSLIDMIQDTYSRFRISKELIEDIRKILEEGKYKCLVLLDGLDEWNLSGDSKKRLSDKGIPNCRDMPKCTILITMRPSTFMDVEHMYRKNFDKVVRLHGLDDKGMKDLTTNILSNYFHKEGDKFHDEHNKIVDSVSSASFELKSLMNIPMLAVFCILTWHEEVKAGNSLTTFYLSIIETLIKRSPKTDQIIQNRGDIPDLFWNYPHVFNRLSELASLGEIAFRGLASENTTLIFNEEQLNERLEKETLDCFLRIGLLNILQTSGKIHENKVRISFLHTTIQEFVSALYLFHGKSKGDIVKFVSTEVSDIDKALNISTVLTFLSGLSPEAGSEISNHITQLSNKDKDIGKFRENFSNETYNKVFHLFKFQLSCRREAGGWKSINDFQKNETSFSFSDVIILGNYMDRPTLRECADVLRFHADDIKSLYIKFVPDDDENGITNDVLTSFLHETKSLEALDIDGYHDRKCRLFDDSSKILPCLRTIGLFNVAFSDNIMPDLLTSNESRKEIKALGLFHIKSDDDLDVDFQYQFPSIHRLLSTRSDYVQKRIAYQYPEISEFQMKEKEHKPLLKGILDVLQWYDALSTLHVSYMDSEEDRKGLLCVLPKIKKLTNFGYIGTSIYPKPNDVYDTEVIKVLLKIKQLQIIFLIEMVLAENILDFHTFSDLKQVTLEVFSMEQCGWATFVSSLSGLKTLKKVILNDTNIDEGNFDRLQSSCSSFDIIKDESAEW